MSSSRQDAEAQARARTQATGRLHLAKEGPGGWTVARTSLPAPAHVDAEGARGARAELPPDPRPSLIRQIPPYGGAG